LTGDINIKYVVLAGNQPVGGNKMQKQGFTPGPWEVSSGAVQTLTGIPIANMDREPGNGTMPVERDRNAQLIAQAPELYKQLSALVGQIEASGHLIVPPNVTAVLKAVQR
jgi:hypothetical protein